MASSLPTPQEIADKQIKVVSASTDAYRKGIQRVQTAPGVSAAQKKDKYLNGVQNNVDKWATNVASVTLASWAQSAVEKGSQRLGQGISAARSKIESFWTDFLPYLGSVQQQVNAMPSDTFEQRLAKMDANARGLHQFKRRR